MITIWKYPLVLQGSRQDFMVPAGATLLPMGVQQGVPTLWFLINTTNGKVKRSFRIYGTGHEIYPRDLESLSPVGTAITDLGSRVWHVFEIVAAPQAH